jgi:DMSO/TMAO reductase YedYZ molybdopterin-dependent catalytic subunit
MTKRRGIPALLGRRLALTVALVWLAAAAPGDAPEGVIVTGPASQQAATLNAAALARLPTTQESVGFMTEHGPQQANFSGPKLWDVLAAAGAIAADKPREQVRLVVLIEGSDGYTATLALGEIAPEFEGKTVLLALSQDGKPLAPGHWRVVVPGDKRGGRSVRDVVRVTVTVPK